MAVCQRTSRGPLYYCIFSMLRPPKTAIIMYWVPALMKNSNNYKIKLKFHLFGFIKNALFKVLIDSFQQKLLKLNGSKDSNVRLVYTEPGNPDIFNNAILNIFSSIIDLAGSPVLIRAVRNARTEWKKHVHGRGEAVELIIVVVDSAVHGDSLGVPGGVDDGGQVGWVDGDAAYVLIFDSADAPVLVRAVRAAHTEWKKHELGRGEAVELIIVVVDSAIHGDALGVPGGVDDGGQVGRVDDDAYMLIERFFEGPEGPDVNNIDHVNDDNLTANDSVKEGLLDTFW